MKATRGAPGGGGGPARDPALNPGFQKLERPRVNMIAWVEGRKRAAEFLPGAGVVSRASRADHFLVITYTPSHAGGGGSLANTAQRSR